MMLEEIWSKLNTSCLLVLPIYSRILKNNTYTKNKKVKIPFIQYCLEAGLIQTFLEDKFIMLFEKEVVINGNMLVTSDSTSFSEVLISSDYFDSIKYVDDFYIAYSFNIPENYLDDINLIKESKYSKVSKEYKSELLITQSKVATLKNKLSNNIAAYNIPYGVVSKSRYIAKNIRNIFSVPDTKPLEEITKDYELFPKFNKIKETFKI